MHYNDWVPFDGLLITMEAKHTLVTDDSTLTKVTAESTEGLLTDMYCRNPITSGKYDDTNCSDDADETNKNLVATSTDSGNKLDYTAIAPDSITADTTDFCHEKWTVKTIDTSTFSSTSSPGLTKKHERCVKIKIGVKRLFKT